MLCGVIVRRGFTIMHYRASLIAFSLAFAASSPAAAQSTSGPSQPVDSAAVASACGGEVQHDAFVKLPKAEQVRKLSCFTREAAVRFNKTLPNKVDNVTTLERVEANGPTLTYYYTVNILKAELRPGALESFKPVVSKKVCDAADMRSIVSVGGSYRYVWADRVGEKIGELLVNAC